MKRLKIILAIILVILIIGFAGRADWAEEVLESVSYELYHEINNKLGGDASDYEIATYYMDHYRR